MVGRGRGTDRKTGQSWKQLSTYTHAHTHIRANSCTCFTAVGVTYVSPDVQAPPPALGVLPQALVDDSEELHQSTVLAQVILKKTHTPALTATECTYI